MTVPMFSPCAPCCDTNPCHYLPFKGQDGCLFFRQTIGSPPVPSCILNTTIKLLYQPTGTYINGWVGSNRVTPCQAICNGFEPDTLFECINVGRPICSGGLVVNFIDLSACAIGGYMYSTGCFIDNNSNYHILFSQATLYNTIFPTDPALYPCAPNPSGISGFDTMPSYFYPEIVFGGSCPDNTQCCNSFPDLNIIASCRNSSVDFGAIQWTKIGVVSYGPNGYVVDFDALNHNMWCSGVNPPQLPLIDTGSCTITCSQVALPNYGPSRGYYDWIINASGPLSFKINKSCLPDFTLSKVSTYHLTPYNLNQYLSCNPALTLAAKFAIYLDGQRVMALDNNGAPTPAYSYPIPLDGRYTAYPLPMYGCNYGYILSGPVLGFERSTVAINIVIVSNCWYNNWYYINSVGYKKYAQISGLPGNTYENLASYVMAYISILNLGGQDIVTSVTPNVFDCATGYIRVTFNIIADDVFVDQNIINAGTHVLEWIPA